MKETIIIQNAGDFPVEIRKCIKVDTQIFRLEGKDEAIKHSGKPCINNGKQCPCSIYGGQFTIHPLLFNQPFPDTEKKIKELRIKQDIDIFEKEWSV